MRPLYEIDQDILACVDQETGEILDTERLDALQLEREAKQEGVALWIKDMVAESEAVKAEADKLNARRKSLENKIAGLKRWLAYSMGGEKLKTARVMAYTKSSVKLNVIDEQSAVNYIATHYTEPEEFLKYALPELRKDALKAEIKAGKEIPGLALEQTESVVIK